jgi:outer membrane immunogenic protein
MKYLDEYRGAQQALGSKLRVDADVWWRRGTGAGDQDQFALETDSDDGLGFRASPYFGYNWQFAPRWVTGVEGDVGFARQTSVRAAFPVPLALAEVDPSGTDILTVKATWDASLRGRLGFLVTPSTLAYATGGVAWQHYDVTSTCGCTGIVNLTPKVVSDSTTKAGWTVGGGLETVLWGNWLARAEYSKPSGQTDESRRDV